MENLKKAVVGLSLGLSILLTGCGENVYTKEQLKVDSSSKIVYEKDGKTLANGSFSYKNAVENGKVTLDNGLIETLVVTKGNDKMEAKYKDKKLQLLDFGNNSKVEYFENGDLKYLEFHDEQTKAKIKYNKGEKQPYYFFGEIKPTNAKVVLENDILTVSKLNNNQVIETHEKSSQKGQKILVDINDMIKNMANLLSENTYNGALKEMN